MKRDVYGSILTGAVLAGTAILMGACVSHSNANAQITKCTEVKQDKGDRDVKIQFDAAGCPTKVEPQDEDFEVERGKRIVWQSVGPENTTPGYEIYFDPFKGGPLKSNNKGNLKSNPFVSCSPAGQYKYTIVGDNCKDKPLDPRFRLR